MQQVATTPVAGKVQLWEVLGAGALLYFGWKTLSGRFDANTANQQAGQAGTDQNTRIAITLYSAMVPGYGSTDTDTVLNLGKTITNFNAVADAYKNLYQRVLSDDLAKYLKAADLETFLNEIAAANVNQGTMDVNQEATKFYGILHSFVPVNDAQYVQLMNLAQDINNSGADNPMVVLNNTASAYKAKFGSDMMIDLGGFFKKYDPDFASDHLDEFNAAVQGQVFQEQDPTGNYKDPWQPDTE